MKKRFLFVIMYLTVLVSCTRVIELDLKDSEMKYVVEGIITDEPGVCKVMLTKTKNFNENNQFEKVSRASVTIVDNGTTIHLSETSAGVYETSLVNGAPGNTYGLRVEVDGQVFTASSTMPQPVAMDTLYVSKGPLGQFKFASITYTDPAGINNGYRFIQYVNDVKESSIFWDDDEFTDGQITTIQLDGGVDDKDDPRNIKTGDKVTIEMLSLDEPIHEYWYMQATGGGDGNGNTAAPANPTTNVTGGALGYFSAHTISRKSVIAP